MKKIDKEIRECLLISFGAIPAGLIRWQIGNHFLVNVLGALILGFFLAMPFYKRYFLLVSIGFCGALTTFSGWIISVAALIGKGSLLKAIYLLLITFLMGIFGIFLGYFSGRLFIQQVLPQLRRLIQDFLALLRF